MTQLEPWTSEPVGPEFVYMARAGGPGGRSNNGFQWPRHGYVEAVPPLLNPTIYMSDHSLGLWGFKEGGEPHNWMFALDPRGMGYGESFQVFVANESELAPDKWEKGWFYAAPRGWVKYSGSLYAVEQALLHEGTETALKTRANMLAGAAWFGIYSKRFDAEPWTQEPFGPEYGYMLRKNAPGSQGYEGFQWPQSGYVEAPEWDGRADNNKGLFGYLGGVGDIRLGTPGRYNRGPEEDWMVFKIRLDEIHACDALEGISPTSFHRLFEYKAPRGWVKYSGNFFDILRAVACEGLSVQSNRLFVVNSLISWSSAHGETKGWVYENAAAILRGRARDILRASA